MSKEHQSLRSKRRASGSFSDSKRTQLSLEEKIENVRSQITEQIACIKKGLSENDSQNPLVKIEDENQFIDALEAVGLYNQFGDLVELRIKLKELLLEKKSSVAKPPHVSSSSSLLNQAASSASVRHDSTNAWYVDSDITSIVELRLRAFGGFAEGYHFRLNHQFQVQDGQHCVVLVTPAVDVCSNAAPIDFYFDREKQQQPDVGQDDDRRDVFGEISDLVSEANDNANINILFPYNITNLHWLTGEVSIDKRGHHYTIKLYAHDPYGNGNFTKANADLLFKTIMNKIRLLDSLSSFEKKWFISPYKGRQNKADTNSCGVIVVEDILLRIQGSPLTQAVYPVNAAEVRQSHISMILKERVSSGRPTYGQEFLERHVINWPRIVASVASSTVNPATTSSMSKPLKQSTLYRQSIQEMLEKLTIPLLQNLYNDYLEIDRNYLGSNALSKELLNGIKSDTAQYFLPHEIKVLLAHFNKMTELCNDLSIHLIQRKSAQTIMTASELHQLNQLLLLIKGYLESLKNNMLLVKGLKERFWGDEKQATAAANKYREVKDHILTEFTKLTGVLVPSANNDEVKSWFDWHSFTCISCISTLLRAYLPDPDNIVQNAAKLMMFYFVMTNQVDVDKCSTGEISIPFQTDLLLRKENKESLVESDFSDLLSKLRSGFSSTSNRREMLSLVLQNVEGQSEQRPLMVQ